VQLQDLLVHFDAVGAVMTQLQIVENPLGSIGHTDSVDVGGVTGLSVFDVMLVVVVVATRSKACCSVTTSCACSRDIAII
jgi:hypothetical protein